MISSPQNCGCPIIPEGASISNSTVCGQYLFMMLLESYLWGRCDISTPCSRLKSIESTQNLYDYIVVGAGTAGSIVAGRLSENGVSRVLVLEAGGPEPIGTRVPSFYRSYWTNKNVEWGYRTEPGNYCLDQGDKGCVWLRGKGVGGTNLINGMMYHEGHTADYDNWAKAAKSVCWSREKLQPYFDMNEGNNEIGSVVSGKYHSATGKMPVERFNYQPPEIVKFLKLLNDSGFPIIADMNNPNTPEGFTVAQALNYNEQRYTTARVYLSPKYSNLSVKMYAHVTKVLFDGTRAVGVEYLDFKGNFKTARASKEIILSAGTLNTPQILMLSGIGPKSVLKEFNISNFINLPVGKNLINHIGATIYFLIPNLTNTQILDWNVFTKYILTKGGPMSSTGLSQMTGFLYSSLANRTRKQPDIQVFFNGLHAECSKTGVIGEPVTSDPLSSYNISISMVLLQPRSVGHMTLRSKDPLDPPLFFANYLNHSDDTTMLKDAFKYIEDFYKYQLTNKSSIKIELDTTYTKVCDDKHETWSDKWTDCMIRMYTDPQNHQMGTTALGSVLDDKLKVHGIENLRVCDAGSIPTHVSGNPQGAIMVLAEKCADLVKQKWE